MYFYLIVEDDGFDEAGLMHEREFSKETFGLLVSLIKEEIREHSSITVDLIADKLISRHGFEIVNFSAVYVM